jgi:radical SAM superfamily enzyme YgiQ (UPF0313 family)
MRIYLISPTHYAADGTLVKSRHYWTSALTLPYLKALTPPPHEVRFVDEIMGDVDLNADCDLVGITTMGPQIRRGYELGDWFRRRGKRVVMGGQWVSLNPEQALEHCDAVVRGEAEYVWADLLSDFENGRNRIVYQADRWHDLRNLPKIDYTSLPLLLPDRFRRSAFYRWYFHWPILASRGCPHACDFCSIQTYYGRSYRNRPVEDVLDDFLTVKRLGGNRVLVLDDNPIGNVAHAKELFRALAPLHMQWATQCTINIARNEELLALAARAGLRTLTIGFESLSKNKLKQHGKAFNAPEQYAEDIRRIRAHGIQIIALFMVGLDGDGEESFDEIFQFLIRNRIAFLKLFTPCPFPGTKYFEDMERAGRLLTRDWNEYDYGNTVVRPAGMTPEAMLEGFTRLYRRFYSLPSIARRFFPPAPGNYTEGLFYAIANLKINRFLAATPHAWGTIS